MTAKNPALLRRRKLGRTSCREIAKLSETGIAHACHDFPKFPLPRDVDLVFRWGCTANVPCKNVVNTAAAIHEVNNKAQFRLKLQEKELCPYTWVDANRVPEHMLRAGVVVRPKAHSRGRKFYLCHTRPQIQEAVGKCGQGYYVSEYINKRAEYRVAVVQGRVVWVAEKTPANPDEPAWNVAKGGRFDNVRWDDWPLNAVRLSVEAFELSDLDFGGVDVMISDEGDPYVIEINSAPSLTSPYRQECMAKAFDWIVRKGKERIPRIKKRGGYTKFIHPAVCDRAKLVGDE